MTDGDLVDVLVITDGSRAVDVGLEADARILFRVSPRVAVLRTRSEAVPTLRRLPGVVSATEEHAATAVPEHLDEAERTFVEAWQRREHGAGRPHDGMAWDAPGLAPPDGPSDEPGDGRDEGTPDDSTTRREQPDDTDEP